MLKQHHPTLVSTMNEQVIDPGSIGSDLDKMNAIAQQNTVKQQNSESSSAKPSL
jgi:hypothetical protein